MKATQDTKNLSQIVSTVHIKIENQSITAFYIINSRKHTYVKFACFL